VERTSKRPIQGDTGSTTAESVVVGIVVVGGDGLGLLVDEGRVESTMTRHSMPSDNSVFTPGRTVSALEVC